ncbi:MAG: hypothetical protein GEU93_01510 [Propionibacteriales bacterium]|nr:hypothetical protein [Propionibacteriales bacterium]
MNESKNWPGKKLIASRSSRLAEAVWLLRHVDAVFDRIDKLDVRVRQLEGALHENLMLHRRVAELTDIVQELLLPVAQRDEKRVRELLDQYSEKL